MGKIVQMNYNSGGLSQSSRREYLGGILFCHGPIGASCGAVAAGRWLQGLFIMITDLAFVALKRRFKCLDALIRLIRKGTTDFGSEFDTRDVQFLPAVLILVLLFK